MEIKVSFEQICLLPPYEKIEKEKIFNVRKDITEKELRDFLGMKSMSMFKVSYDMSECYSTNWKILEIK